MHAEIINTLDEFQKCERLYEMVLSKMEPIRDNVFQLYKWHEISLKTFLCKPLIVVIYEGASPVALFPLWLRESNKWGVPYQYIEFINSQNVNYYEFMIVREVDHDEILRTFFKALKSLEKINSTYIDLPPLVINNLDSLSRKIRSFSFIENVLYTTAAPFAAIEGDWDWYFRSYIKKKLRDDFKRLIGKATREIGEVTLDYASPAELDLFFEMHIKEWEKRGEKSRYLTLDNRQFEKALLSDFKFIDFSKLVFGKHTVAYHLGYKYRGHFYYSRPAFNIQFDHFSPGKLLLMKLLEREIRQGSKIFDLGRGQQQYKYWFAKDDLHLTTIRIFYNKKIYSAFKLMQNLSKGKKDENKQSKMV